jgi:hypothetical protein
VQTDEHGHGAVIHRPPVGAGAPEQQAMEADKSVFATMVCAMSRLAHQCRHRLRDAADLVVVRQQKEVEQHHRRILMRLRLGGDVDHVDNEPQPAGLHQIIPE